MIRKAYLASTLTALAVISHCPWGSAQSGPVGGPGSPCDGYARAASAGLPLPGKRRAHLPRLGQATVPAAGAGAQGAPNIVLILIDDAGFGQFGTFGGGVPSPTMDKLATEGLRYSRFHTTALCSPTRAALITGRNHHSSASGVIAEIATGYEGYTTVIPRSHGSVGEVLRQNGYMTAWIGKNHNTPPWQASEPARSTAGRTASFDYFYGFNGGDMNYWNPTLYENRNPVPAQRTRTTT